MRRLLALAILISALCVGCSGEQHTGQPPASGPASQLRTYTAPNGLFTVRLHTGSEAASGGEQRWWHVMTYDEADPRLPYLDRMQYVRGTEMTPQEQLMLEADGNEEFVLYMWLEAIQPYLVKQGPDPEVIYEQLETVGDVRGVMAAMHLPGALAKFDHVGGEPVESYDQVLGYFVWQENGVVMLASGGRSYDPKRVSRTQAMHQVISEARALAQQVTVRQAAEVAPPSQPGT